MFPWTFSSYSLYAFHAAQWGFSLPYLREHPWKNRIAITSLGYFDYTSYVLAFKEDGYRARALTLRHELQHTSRATTQLRITQGFLLPAFFWSWFSRKSVIYYVWGSRPPVLTNCHCKIWAPLHSHWQARKSETVSHSNRIPNEVWIIQYLSESLKNHDDKIEWHLYHSK